MDKYNLEYKNNGILLSLKKNKKTRNLPTSTININLDDIMLNLMNQPKIRQILYESTYMGYLK